MRSTWCWLLLAGACSARPLELLRADAGSAPPDLATVSSCSGDFHGAVAGTLDSAGGPCAVFVVDDPDRSIFSLKTFPAPGRAAASASLDLMRLVSARSYRGAEVQFGRVQLDAPDGRQFVAGVEGMATLVGSLTLTFDSVSAPALDPRAKPIHDVHGRLDAQLVDSSGAPAVDLRVLF